MARAQKSHSLAGDGMAWLQVMPFPALNPWNWWALTAPRNAALAAAKGAQVAVEACRCYSDAARIMVRQQQDLMLRWWETPANAAEASAAAAASEQTNASSAQAQADFVTPMMEVTRAYSRAGKAFIVAQRNSLRAFTQPEKPH